MVIAGVLLGVEEPSRLDGVLEICQALSKCYLSVLLVALTSKGDYGAVVSYSEGQDAVVGPSAYMSCSVAWEVVVFFVLVGLGGRIPLPVNRPNLGSRRAQVRSICV